MAVFCRSSLISRRLEHGISQIFIHKPASRAVTIQISHFINQTESFNRVTNFTSKLGEPCFRREIVTTRCLYQEETRKCWNCGRENNPKKEHFFCECGIVQKPALGLTYFDMFDIHENFDIDIVHLSRLHKLLQMKLHPDRFSQKSEIEQKIAEDQSSLLNKAFSTLHKPLPRAMYLLELHGKQVCEQDKSTEDSFLIEIMETNEEIADANCVACVERIEAVNQARIADCVKRLSGHFHNKDFNAAKETVIHMKYYDSIGDKIKDLRTKSFS